MRWTHLSWIIHPSRKNNTIVTELPLSNLTSAPAGLLVDVFAASNDKTYTAYKGTNKIKPKWFLVQVDLSINSDALNTGVYHVDFFC